MLNLHCPSRKPAKQKSTLKQIEATEVPRHESILSANNNLQAVNATWWTDLYCAFRWLLATQELLLRLSNQKFQIKYWKQLHVIIVSDTFLY